MGQAIAIYGLPFFIIESKNSGKIDVMKWAIAAWLGYGGIVDAIYAPFLHYGALRGWVTWSDVSIAWMDFGVTVLMISTVAVALLSLRKLCSFCRLSIKSL